jgi:prepilin-type N-terminal cleavage/methylation domain-containing protein
MNKKNYNYNKGFTLIETLVTIFIFGILMVGVTLLLRNIFLNSKNESQAMNNVDQTRVVANTFVNEIRNSTYGINGAYPINQTTDTQMIFFSTAPKNNGTISRVRYYVSNGILYKGITDPSGTPLDYNLSNEKITTILPNMSLGSNPLFYYYDGSYDGTNNPLTQPVNITQVKFAEINLIVLRQIVQGGTDTFNVTAGGTFRNLKTNLGN